MAMKNKILQLFFCSLAAAGFTLSSGCDLNPLGGSKSTTGVDFEPGKHIPKSHPPTISVIPDFVIDENDTQTIPFTISDPETFMVCSLVFVKAYSANYSIIDPTGLIVGGLYPNCTLTITPKAYQYGTTRITLDVYNFWLHAFSPFNLNVIHIMSPGAFLIVDAEGNDKSVDLTWQNAAYMFGSGAFTSPYYTVFYRPVGTSTFSSISHVTSPFTVTGLTNGVDYDFYVNAYNSLGNRNSNTVQATPTKYKFRGPEFIASASFSIGGSTQYQATPGTAYAPARSQIVNSTLVSALPTVDANYPTLNYTAPENPVENGVTIASSPKGSSIQTPDGKYKVYLNSQGNILSGAQQ